jgi:hypothetical protein
VRIAGEPFATTIGARMVETPGTMVATTHSDADGRYSLGLPPGIYRIELDARFGGGFTSGDLRDTVHVAAGVRSHDLLLGTLIARVEIPRVPDGVAFRCTIDPPPLYGFSNRDAIARDGWVEFEYPIVEPGIHRLQLVANSYPGVWLPGTTDRRAADVVYVGTARTTEYRTSVRNYAVISGTIRGSWQESDLGLAPQVNAITMDRRTVGSARCTADGRFTLMVLELQPVRLEVSLTGIDRWIGGDTFETATTFHLHPGRSIEGISFVEGGIVCQLEGPGQMDRYLAEAVLHDQMGGRYAIPVVYENSVRICNLKSGAYRLYLHGDCDSAQQPWPVSGTTMPIRWLPQQSYR